MADPSYSLFIAKYDCFSEKKVSRRDIICIILLQTEVRVIGGMLELNIQDRRDTFL